MEEKNIPNETSVKPSIPPPSVNPLSKSNDFRSANFSPSTQFAKPPPNGNTPSQQSPDKQGNKLPKSTGSDISMLPDQRLKSEKELPQSAKKNSKFTIIIVLVIILLIIANLVVFAVLLAPKLSADNLSDNYIASSKKHALGLL